MYVFDFYIKSKTLEKNIDRLKDNYNLFFKLRKENKYCDYFNIPFSFDIETTQYIDFIILIFRSIIFP